MHLTKGGDDQPDSAANSFVTSQNLQGYAIEIIGLSHFEFECTFCASRIAQCIVQNELSGQRRVAHGRPLYASDYDFNDDLLTVDAKLWVGLDRDCLGADKSAKA